jgi:hypothetical protein
MSVPGQGGQPQWEEANEEFPQPGDSGVGGGLGA